MYDILHFLVCAACFRLVGSNLVVKATAVVSDVTMTLVLNVLYLFVE